MIEGTLIVNDVELEAGDGAATSDENKLALSAASFSHFILFDLA